MKGNPKISRADIAAFLHEAAHSPEWIGHDAVITDRPSRPPDALNRRTCP
ncbi:hypothetical protein ACSCBZ_20225 [Streptomyces niveiscabiei]